MSKLLLLLLSIFYFSLSYSSELSLNNETSDVKVAAAAFASFFSCEGKAFACGDGQSNLGLYKDFTDKYNATQIRILGKLNITNIFVSDIGRFAIDNSGKVYAWGSNHKGQLGLGDFDDRQYPNMVNSLSPESISLIACGLYHTLALNTQGKIFASGYLPLAGENAFELVESEIQNKTIIQVSSGDYFSLALDNQGDVYAWGRNSYGDLGLGDYDMRFKPALIKGLEGKKIIKISSNGYHSLVLDNSGNVYSWGLNADGQLGLGDYKDRLVPNPIASLKSIKIVEIFAGGGMSFAIDSDGKLYEWGLVPHKGIETKNIPSLNKDLEDKRIVRVSSENTGVFAVDEQGNIYAWGENQHGRLGLGDAQDRKSPTAIKAFCSHNSTSNYAASPHNAYDGF